MTAKKHPDDKMKPGPRPSGKKRFMYMIYPDVHQAVAEIAAKLQIPGSVFVEAAIMEELAKHGVNFEDRSFMSKSVRSDAAIQYTRAGGITRGGLPAFRGSRGPR